jgi:hypothetical protein
MKERSITENMQTACEEFDSKCDISFSILRGHCNFCCHGKPEIFKNVPN